MPPRSADVGGAGWIFRTLAARSPGIVLSQLDVSSIEQ
jgi:hypothetical protein